MQPVALSIADAVQLSGLGRSKLYQSIASGELAARKYGRRTLILRGDLERFLSALPQIASSRKR